MTSTGRRFLSAGCAILLLLAAASWGYAQFQGRGRLREGVGRFGNSAARFRPPGITENGFVICRLWYNRVRYESMGMGWSTDYPYAEINLSTRLSELTKVDTRFEGEGEPSHWVVQLTDDALFDCPFLVASDVGTAGLEPQEAERLRAYLLKGGFLWVDDFWGNEAWDHWVGEISKALPPSEYPIFDVSPSHPIYRVLFQMSKVPQITNIQFWRSVGGRTTSERGAETAEAHLRAIADKSGRIVVLMSHNTDIADSWEREGEDIRFFYQFSPDGYAMGINAVLYALTH